MYGMADVSNVAAGDETLNPLLFCFRDSQFMYFSQALWLHVCLICFWKNKVGGIGMRALW